MFKISIRSCKLIKYTINYILKMQSHLKTTFFSVVSLCIILLKCSGVQAQERELTELVKTLNQHILNLEKRVVALEKNSIKKFEVIPKGLQDWRKIEKGMSKMSVKKIIGEPKRIEGAVYTYWYYSTYTSHSYVAFDNGYVVKWSEPK